MGTDWQRAEELCHAALLLDQKEQAAFLKESCAGNNSLRREVESLLAHQNQADQFIEVPALELAAQALAEDRRDNLDLNQCPRLIGRRISHYLILEELGSGGMGEVYRAARSDDQYQKQVAIKLVRAGFDTEFILRRFRNERQVLASLTHPNIASLLDGGTTDDGLPYFVLELVEGQPIDQFCKSRRLPTVDRLRLFRTLCSAVHHAHQRLVVHRDIKPRNILVTSEGVPKLLDFGIAKILHSEIVSDGYHPTVTALRLMTPEYASPEQIKGEPITTATDVYSLGVVLYYLLTGILPYGVSSGASHQLAQAICEAEPERPSTAIRRIEAALHDRGAPNGLMTDSESAEQALLPSRFPRRLARDIDHVVLKAIRKEPQDRYSSVEQFSEDIERCLEGRPVIARPRTLLYRGVKFINRNKFAVAATALLAVALIAGMVTTTRQRIKAEKRFNDVRELANALVFEVHDSIQDLPGATAARQLLVSKALRYLDSLAQESAGDFSLQRELAAAYEKVGDVQGNPNHANLGDTAGALKSYRKALAILESVAASDNGSAQTQRTLAVVYLRVGLVLIASGDYNAALDYSRRAFAILDRLAMRKSDWESEELLAGSYFQVALCLADLGDFKGALENFQESAAIREGITANSPGHSARVEMRLAGVYGWMARVVDHEGNTDTAIAIQRKAGQIMTKLYDSDPTNATYHEYFNESHFFEGVYLQNRGDLVQALANYGIALSGFEALARADPNEARVKRLIGMCKMNMGTVIALQGDSAGALRNIRGALSIFEDLYRRDPSENADRLPDIAAAYGALGLAFSRKAGRLRSAPSLAIAELLEARSAYQKSFDTWIEVKRRGALSRLDDDEPGRIAAEIAKCDTALAAEEKRRHNRTGISQVLPSTSRTLESILKYISPKGILTTVRTGAPKELPCYGPVAFF